ncbi:MAG: DOMON domain-containing protein, partial [Planctomycetota bacterium]
MTGLVPTRLLFDFELPIRYRQVPPSVSGDISEWDEKYLLPELCRLDSQRPFGQVYAAWNEDGLYAAVSVTGKRQPLRCDPSAFWKSDHLRICVDFRDTRTIKRATRFCQQFYLLPTGGGRRRDQPAGGG